LPALVIIQGIAGDAASISLARGAALVLGICLFVVAVALASCAVPLRRALNVDPIRALRAE
jgi:ABC-type lipoprotein release transport system permease subunit